MLLLILGLGTDVCPIHRWEHLLTKFGEKAPLKILHASDANYLLSGNREQLPKRLAGRWALLEAFGKALGLGLSGWHWKQLRFFNGKLWAENELAIILQKSNIQNIHASISHDAGIAFAVVILEGTVTDTKNNLFMTNEMG